MSTGLSTETTPDLGLSLSPELLASIFSAGGRSSTYTPSYAAGGNASMTFPSTLNAGTAPTISSGLPPAAAVGDNSYYLPSVSNPNPGLIGYSVTPGQVYAELTGGNPSGGGPGMPNTYTVGQNVAPSLQVSALGTLQNIMGQYVNSYNQGVQANEQLYNNVVGGYQNLYSSQMQGLAGLGQAQSNALDQQFAQEQAATAQQLINAGLNNTSVMTANQQGINSQLAIAKNNLASQIQQQYLGTQESNATGALQAMQSMQLQYPTLDQMGSLAESIAQIANSQGSGNTAPVPVGAGSTPTKVI